MNWENVFMLVQSVVLVLTLWLGFRGERRDREKQHLENAQRLTRIETMLQPISDWWNGTKGER